MTRCLVLLLALVAPAWMPSTAAAQTPACATLPANIVVPAGYQGLVEDLIARSPTLHRQCLAIASAPQVRVSLQAGRRMSGQCRARTSFTRKGDGALRASILIPVSVDFAELLAHEFEHVLEQIEGISLRRLSRRRDSGVYEIGRNVFETTRATRAGRRAAVEMRACADGACEGRVVMVAAKD